MIRSKPTPILIVGLDGFDPDLAQRWMSEGKLPNLSRLAEFGNYSPLRSTVPHFTYPAWSTFLTGTNPGKHGIIDFSRRKFNTYQIEFINSTYRQFPTFLNLFNQCGLKPLTVS